MGQNRKEKKKEKQGKGPTHDLTPEAYEFDVFPANTLSLKGVNPSEGEVSDEEKKAYEDALEKLQEAVFREQIRLHLSKQRVVFVIEGWDAAGKGGAIKRLTYKMDPRGYKDWSVAAPKDAEARHHYLWRFWQKMPDQGEVAIFDRSWYGRVLVERIEGFATGAQWKRAYDEINAFEKMLTDDGVLVVKFFLHISKDEQLERFRDREQDVQKNYKIGPDDWRNRKRWKEYEVAYQEMFDRTHRPDAPWIIVPANDKKAARQKLLKEALRLMKKLG